MGLTGSGSPVRLLGRRAQRPWLRRTTSLLARLARNQVTPDGLPRYVRIFLNNGLKRRQVVCRVRRLDCVARISFIREPSVEQNGLSGESEKYVEKNAAMQVFWREFPCRRACIGLKQYGGRCVTSSG